MAASADSYRGSLFNDVVGEVNLRRLSEFPRASLLGSIRTEMKIQKILF